MRIHSVTIRAIGPFAGEHRIDVARLAASGIFLLDGPTGAGKSTLIDAVVFALYGKVASESASDDRLRSAFAGPDVESFVDLVVETSAGIFRMRRTPEYRRAKKRGAGTTTQQATVKLWRLGRVPAPDALDETPGELLSTRLDEAGAEIQRFIGLDRRQFVQTVVLPQGEFASFLRAEPERRRDLLQKVFGTEIYERVAAGLAEMSRTARSRVDTARQAVAGAVEQFLGASAVDEEEASGLREAARDESRLGACDLGALVRQRTDVLVGEAEALAAVETTAVVELAAARERFDAARTRLGALRRRDELRADRDRLRDDAPQVETVRHRLADARRAALAAPALDRARHAHRDVDVAREHVELARGAVPAALADTDASGWEAVRSDVVTAAVRLERLADVGATFPERERRLADARKELARDAEERERLRADLAERPAMRARLLDRRTALAETASARELHRERLRHARVVEEAVVRLGALTQEHATAQARLSQVAATARAAVDEEHETRRRWIAGIAGDLAVALAPGDPCPVCGAREHPDLATRAPEHPGREDVEAAEQAREAAESAMREASVAVTTLAERLAATRDVAEGCDLVEARRRVEEISGAVTASDAAHVELGAVDAELGAFDAATTELGARVEEVEAGIVSRQAEETELSRALREDREEIEREISVAGPLVGDIGLSEALAAEGGAANPVSTVVSALRSREHALSDLLEADAALDRALRALAERTTEQDRALAESGFATPADADAAFLTPEECAVLDAEVSRYEIARGSVDEALAGPQLAGLGDATVADAETETHSLDKAVAAAEEKAREQARRHGVAARLAEAARAASDDVDAAVQRWETARADAGPVLRLATLAAGSGPDNPAALSLATFVLVRRFEEVVASANERLREMSSGRYELVRSTSREDVRARKTGLAMKVLDHVTEQARDPRTLSGGETFYVSLCLALGLADVVTAEAGGVELGTLFVDEGFGSLDPATLDAVLGELGRLRAGGRVVGVVSHVEALKQSIAERIEVRRVPGGGSTLTVRA